MGAGSLDDTSGEVLTQEAVVIADEGKTPRTDRGHDVHNCDEGEEEDEDDEGGRRVWRRTSSSRPLSFWRGPSCAVRGGRAVLRSSSPSYATSSWLATSAKQCF